jgi:hypothetical protein
VNFLSRLFGQSFTKENDSHFILPMDAPLNAKNFRDLKNRCFAQDLDFLRFLGPHGYCSSVSGTRFLPGWASMKFNTLTPKGCMKVGLSIPAGPHPFCRTEACDLGAKPGGSAVVPVLRSLLGIHLLAYVDARKRQLPVDQIGLLFPVLLRWPT